MCNLKTGPLDKRRICCTARSLLHEVSGAKSQVAQWMNEGGPFSLFGQKVGRTLAGSSWIAQFSLCVLTGAADEI